MSIKNQVQLITYPDSLGGNLKALDKILRVRFSNIFKGGVHILPPFPSSADRGFAPTTYFEIEPKLGTWDDIRRISGNFDVVVDLMVNHISRQSPYFRDFVKRGRKSEYADLFIPLDKIWRDGKPPREDVAKIFLRKPEHPFSTVTIDETGQTETVWTSFGTQDWSEQIDLDVRSESTKNLLREILTDLSRQGIKMVRLDAIGYVIKKPGTSCFMVEPEIYEFMDWLMQLAASLGLELLPEVHAHYSVQFKLAKRNYWVYDFVLPMLILHTLKSKSSRKLRDYLKICPRKQFTMLDCHDGIPVQPDVDDILSVEESKQIVERCVERGANLNRILSEEHKGNGDFDVHQINCTYYAALNNDDDAYLAARAIQFFAPGVPQVYYVGLLAGRNDEQAVQAVGEGRAINRHNFSASEIDQAMKTPVVQRLLKLIRFRNEYPAFDGNFNVRESNDDELVLTWRKAEKECRLKVDLQNSKSVIMYTDDTGASVEYAV
ncbi:MAG: sucrose phosphorylase [Chloroflexi bacterium]|nr:sucrose phosphorylase [Chloroflexota bacterium]